MLLERIQKSKAAKVVALMLAFEMLADLIAPITASALTTGPSQPEMQSFTPVGTSDMVDPFSGDYSYNIPLLDVDGYPININYNSGITMDQEASWVGLGWNINPGAITRNMRGVPDDFSGEKITKRFNMKPNRTYGVSVGAGGEVFGIDALQLNYSIAMNYNNYKGVGFEQSVNASFSAAGPAKGEMTGGLGLTSGQEGLNISPSLSYSRKINKIDNENVKGTGSLGLSFNSRSGLKNLSLSCTVTESATKNGQVARKNTPTSTYSVNGNASISFAMATYTPQVTMPMTNSSFAMSFKTGGTAFGFDGTVNLSGYYSEQRLATNQENLPAFGYMNSQNGIGYDRAIHDMNREKEGAFTENTPALPITNYSYDVFSVNGQGVGGNYRAFRSDFGTLYDPKSTTTSLSADLGIEAAAGNIVHAGVDITVTDVNTTSGKWTSDDNISSRLKFRDTTGRYTGYESWYFKQAGERSVDSDPTLFNTLVGGSDPVRVSLSDPGSPYMDVASGTTLQREYANGITGIQSVSTTNYRAARQKRNEAISYTPFSRYYDALDADILTHGGAMPAYDPATIEGAMMQQHHIGEISVLRADGARYFYGLPAYNIKQQEVTFNVQGRTTNCGTGITTYSAGDNSLNNTLGIDNYYSETETPAYAHSYLLTAIVSPDYVDYDNVQGPSKGDLGTYTKFNYERNTNPFKWRTPVGTNSANFNEGMKSDATDDKGSYVYGEKEVWYLASIETKNYVAIFDLSDRDDGLGVTDSNGTVSTSDTLRRLDAITLYSKPDYEANNTSATPIKKVHFVYDYSLCPNTTNSVGTNNAKLTLKKIYFTYGNSLKAKLSPYEFFYADRDHNGSAEVNYAYNLKGYDRWSNYKPNVVTPCNALDTLSTAEFPYVNQDTATANAYSAAWSLTRIKLPSGGIIKIQYEADDYAYVQDKKAQQMFKVTDFYCPTSSPAPTALSGSAGSAPTHDRLMQTSNYATQEYYVCFQLTTPVATGSIRDVILNNYLGGNLNNIYFRFLMDITKSKDYEYVSGYFDIDDASSAGFGGCGASGPNYTHGWLRLKRVNIGDRSGSDLCNPVAKTAWQFGRLQLPRDVWEQPDPQGSTGKQVIEAMAGSSFIQNIYQTFVGPNATIRNKDFGTHAVTRNSWIRLNTPYGHKLGGGSRVKQITITDNWKAMTLNNTYTPADASYGQTYSYTTVENGQTISSGVASWEPQIGNDENPFRQPVYFREEKRLVPDDESYMEEPFGEMFFPAPGVGYSRVEVRNLQHTGVERHATGYTVQEFYTAKDYPTIARRTELEAIHKRTNPILSLLKIKMKDYMTASQGFVIELNDMHGKPKAQYVFAEDQEAPISEVHYFYKTNPNNAKQLDNTVYVINKDGSVERSLSGVEYDFVNDMRQQETQMISGGVNLNLAGFLAGIFPAVVPTIFPSWNQEQTRFRSTVVTKVVNRYGVLERTEAHDAGSTVTTENLAWDAETGELLVTRTKNNFDDYVFNFTYPAHWGYGRMGQAYQNLLTGFSGVNISAGSATIVDADEHFVPGDELSILDLLGYDHKGWVCSVSGNTLNIVDEAGAPLSMSNNPCSVIITRSGRRNQQALAIGGVTLLRNPLVDNAGGDGIYDAIEYKKVINAQSQEYQEEWQVQSGHITITPGVVNDTCGLVEGMEVNPYRENALGVWRPVRSHLYLASRHQATASSNTDIRKDGYFVTKDQTTGASIDFQPFWSPNSGADWTLDDTYWTWSSEVTKYTPFGNEVENRDALGRYSAAVFGYNNSLPIAVASNARYQEIAYDGFEDYDFKLDYICERLHFDYRDNYSDRSTQYSHTGIFSMRVDGQDSIRTTRPFETAAPGQSSNVCPFILDGRNMLGVFSPRTYLGDQTYVLNYWVRDSGLTAPVFNYPYGSVRVNYMVAGTPTYPVMTLVQKSDIIEGWQQYQYTFVVPASQTGNIEVVLKNTQAYTSSYFDDIRIHPYNSNMKSYVYHPITLRFTSELDENNYATFYEYDEEGALIRVKKETANGIMTIKESRNNSSH